MFRFIVLFGMLIAFPAWADYEINLSVLDTLGAGEISAELPLPVVKPSTQRAKSPISSVKKTMPKIEKKVEKVEKNEHPSSKVENSVAKEIASSSSDIKQKTATSADSQDVSNNDDTKEKSPEAQIIIENQNNTSSDEIVIDLPDETIVEHNTDSAETSKDLIKTAETSASADDLALIPIDNFGNPRAPEASVLITFDDQSDILTDDVIALLDEFAEKNKDNANDKILIESYHYTGSENVFAHKRISLNRAVNIRTYLLNKGFKSFNIQIINTEEEVMQNNVVVDR